MALCLDRLTDTELLALLQEAASRVGSRLAITGAALPKPVAHPTPDPSISSASTTPSMQWSPSVLRLNNGIVKMTNIKDMHARIGLTLRHLNQDLTAAAARQADAGILIDQDQSKVARIVKELHEAEAALQERRRCYSEAKAKVEVYRRICLANTELQDALQLDLDVTQRTLKDVVESLTLDERRMAAALIDQLGGAVSYLTTAASPCHSVHASPTTLTSTAASMSSTLASIGSSSPNLGSSNLPAAIDHPATVASTTAYHTSSQNNSQQSMHEQGDATKSLDSSANPTTINMSSSFLDDTQAPMADSVEVDLELYSGPSNISEHLDEMVDYGCDTDEDVEISGSKTVELGSTSSGVNTDSFQRAYTGGAQFTADIARTERSIMPAPDMSNRSSRDLDLSSHGRGFEKENSKLFAEPSRSGEHMNGSQGHFGRGDVNESGMNHRKDTHESTRTSSSNSTYTHSNKPLALTRPSLPSLRDVAKHPNRQTTQSDEYHRKRQRSADDDLSIRSNAMPLSTAMPLASKGSTDTTLFNKHTSPSFARDRENCVQWNILQCRVACRRAHRCLRCLSPDHQLRKCPLQLKNPLKVQACLGWNCGPSKTCRNTKCDKSHVCLNCLSHQHNVYECNRVADVSFKQ
ncbi:hypothetical protein BASA83_001875 [Batrachochytrium salamandrivorans]|nr:hypothetical protein BASA81_015146 [Batrachochytrium salamandrivorans]KAH9275590.1 hypothetical protein BASA83_001875 [Batrachochytrium salamandrivorans]